jgi:hypothetical protein
MSPTKNAMRRSLEEVSRHVVGLNGTDLTEAAKKVVATWKA